MSFDSYLSLAIIIIIGYLSGSFRLYSDLDKSIDILNRFSLYIGFPVLMFESLVNKQYSLPSGISFYMAHLISIVLIILFLRLFILTGGKQFKNLLGGLTIGSTFGNVAYLGIPICSQIVESNELGIVSLSAAIHLIIALSIGQFLLIYWSSTEKTSYKVLFNTIIKQPLIWAPVAGVIFRVFPEDIISFISLPLKPIADCAGPISLYMLGLYLYSHKNYIAVPKSATFVIIFFKMLLLPLIFSTIAIFGYKMGLLTFTEVKILILQATMPVAITTFSLTYQYKSGQEIIAQAIVISTILSFLILPLLLAFLMSENLAKLL